MPDFELSSKGIGNFDVAGNRWKHRYLQFQSMKLIFLSCFFSQALSTKIAIAYVGLVKGGPTWQVGAP